MPGQFDYSRIQIAPDRDMAAWWDGTKEKKFYLAECQDCGHRWYPPFPACKSCTSTNVGWHEIEGKGEIYSYIVVAQPIMAHTVPAVPYIVAIIELPDGNNADGSKTRVSGVLLDDEEDVDIGLPVQLAWDDHPSQDYKIPRWKITSKTAANTWRYPN
ncbi:MAG: OB-fold domain-containing protein [Dehalococcoidia bacterium]